MTKFYFHLIPLFFFFFIQIPMWTQEESNIIPTEADQNLFEQAKEYFHELNYKKTGEILNILIKKYPNNKDIKDFQQQYLVFLDLENQWNTKELVPAETKMSETVLLTPLPPILLKESIISNPSLSSDGEEVPSLLLGASLAKLFSSQEKNQYNQLQINASYYFSSLQKQIGIRLTYDKLYKFNDSKENENPEIYDLFLKLIIRNRFFIKNNLYTSGNIILGGGFIHEESTQNLFNLSETDLPATFFQISLNDPILARFLDYKLFNYLSFYVTYGITSIFDREGNPASPNSLATGLTIKWDFLELNLAYVQTTYLSDVNIKPSKFFNGYQITLNYFY